MNRKFGVILRSIEKQISEFQDPAVMPDSSLLRNDPFKILITTLLSLRTKDEVTIVAAKRLFKIAPDISSILDTSENKISQTIYPVGFYKRKAKNIKNVAKILKEKYKGKVPDNLDELLKIPGVGRKTANLVVSVAYNKDGICVDTHVHRISNRLGWVKTKSPDDTELELRKIVHRKYWKSLNLLIVPFGKNICTPISPKCSNCLIEKYCLKINVEISR